MSETTVKELASELGLSIKATCAKLSKECGLGVSVGADTVPKELADKLLNTELVAPSPAAVEVEPDEPEEGTVRVFISSVGVEHSAKTVNNKTSKFIKLFANGEAYEVECDKQVDLPERFYGCVQGLLDKQKG